VGFVLDKVALGQVFLPVLRFSPASFIPPVLHYLEKRKKKLINFITRLQNKPQGCGASVVSAAGPFITKKRVEVFRLAPAVKPNSLHHPVQQQLTTTSVRPPVSHVRCAVSNKQFWQLLPAGQSEIKID
jgi:hypothetical protein